MSFILALPWVDRAQSTSFKARAPVLLGVGLLMAGVVTLSAIAVARDHNDAGYIKGVAQAHKFAQYTRNLAKAGVLPAGGEAVLQNDPKYQAITLFKENCQNCHTVAGVGGNEAPDFSDYNSRAWLSAVIRNPQDPRFFGGIKRKPTDPKHEGMDAYPQRQLPDDDLKAIVEYCLSIGGEEAAKAAHVNAALAAKGAELWSSDKYDCSDCHEVTAGETGDGPNLFGRGSKAWLTKTMTNSGTEDLFGKDAKMPKFGNKLTPEQMGQLAEYIIDSAQKPND